VAKTVAKAPREAKVERVSAPILGAA
jgi:hypothetical protein